MAAQPIVQSPEGLRITMSLGVACCGPSETDGAALVEAADKALYRAKTKGRNRVEVA